MENVIKSIDVQFKGLLEFPFIRSQVRHILQQALSDNYFLVEVALNEAVNNAIIHGSKKEEEVVRLKINITSRKVIVRVKNSGEGFPANRILKQIREKAENQFEEGIYHESGRGLELMTAAFDCMTFNAAGTEVLLVKERIDSFS